jgi:hypothetical protein
MSKKPSPHKGRMRLLTASLPDSLIKQFGTYCSTQHRSMQQQIHHMIEHIIDGRFILVDVSKPIRQAINTPN